MKDLNLIRSDIDKLDKKILILIKKRLYLAEKIGKIKKEKGLPVKDYIREKQILAKMKTSAQSLNIPSELAEKVWLLLLKSSKRLQQ